MTDKQSIIGLITDFGTRDYFIGTLKGVIKQIAPHAEVIDIANEIPSYNIGAAGFTIDVNREFFPKGTIFLAVVDPGVGTERRILLVCRGDRYYIAPDNGLLTPVLTDQTAQVYSLDNPDYFLMDGSSTFEARDKMAPAAAYLADGVNPASMGTPCNDAVMDPNYHPTLADTEDGKIIEGRIAYIDKFGNLMTNIAKDFLLETLEKSGKDFFTVDLAGQSVAEFHDTYGEAKGKHPFLLLGSHNHLEIAINQGSAQQHLVVRLGDAVRVRFISD